MAKAERELNLQPGNSEELLDYLMRRFGGRVVKLAYYQLRDRHLAEDVMQEVFCRVYRNLSRFRQESSYYTWIYRIAANVCADYKRSAWYRRVLPAGGREAAIEDARLFEEVEGGEVFRCVMDLPPKYRTAVALYYFEDMATSDIARVLRLNEGAVRQRLNRARTMLKEALGPDYERR